VYGYGYGAPSGAPYSYRKEKETDELIFRWLSWLAVLLVRAYAQRAQEGDVNTSHLADPMIMAIMTTRRKKRANA